MIEVTNENLDELYPKIEEALKNASFISIDNEFSGLKTDVWFTESLFHTPTERYQHLRKNIQSFIIMQLGFTTFCHYRDENMFKTETFIFYLLPRSIPIKNRHFLWQTSCIEFLTLHGFDFNKFAYKSISYLNETEEKELKNKIEDGSFLRSIGYYVPVDTAGDVTKKVNDVYEWIPTAQLHETFKIEVKTQLMEYLISKELRNRFNNIWTKYGNGEILVIKVESEEKLTFEEQEGSNVLEDKLLRYYIGFSKVFKLLTSMKKPLVGHNVFLDLMFLYKQFYKPLPEKYNDFKQSIHELFPLIYDTKCISFKFDSVVKTKDKWKTNSLSELYKYFKKEKGKHLVMFSPRIEEPVQGKITIHDAGWDSFFAGYVFIKMAHVFAVKKIGSGSELKALTYTEIVSGVKEFLNDVNVIRANVSHVKLDGLDPPSTRPQWLYARLLGSKNQTVTEVAESFASFGNVDVKAIAPGCVLIAVGNHASARSILKHFKSSQEMYIEPYNPLKHSNTAKFCSWCGVILTGGVFTWILYNNISKLTLFFGKDTNFIL